MRSSRIKGKDRMYLSLNGPAMRDIVRGRRDVLLFFNGESGELGFVLCEAPTGQTMRITPQPKAKVGHISCHHFLQTRGLTPGTKFALSEADGGFIVGEAGQDEDAAEAA